MELLHSSDQFAVFDDFLGAEAFQQMQAYLGSENFTYVRSRRWHTAFKLLDGDPLVGSSVLSDHPAPPENVLVHPCGRGIDVVATAIKAALPDLAPWVGKQGEAWEFFTCTSYIYPMGSGLSWHKDAKNRAGSYVLYLHPEWQPKWGAELLLSGTPEWHRGTGDEQPQRATGTPGGIGQFVTPYPNRLVVMKAGVMHAVKKVDVTAGDHARYSIAGFFQTAAEPAPQDRAS
ncbi:2OG-Fe(II) oxygenase [Streptomyces sp. PTM05]|uniref:2OG-Fe(II) oxygenase n=1 Tax=Streptantibioticus parmotrematis TaxID=2873249 RepID=A0ABS7QLF0_9ACTN|nr:2OG-Fe(II) oxygenase [Streptantibioticus parmotrematis]MBY8884017.1 2OG-Fe(II) oxygenase [Streptantibioticus parmotrematis]